MANLAETKLIDLVPPSIRDDEQIKAAAAALQRELDAVTAAIPTTLLISRIDELAEDVIDLLAWQWHVDFYEQGISLEQKRALVKTSIAQHKKKGTPWAVEQVVNIILNEGVVQEWYEYGGEPYYFRVIKINGQMPDAEIYERLKRAIDTVKNRRSWMEGIALYREMAGGVYVGGAVGSTRTINIMPATFNAPNVIGKTYTAGVIYQMKGVTIQHA